MQHQLRSQGDGAWEENISKTARYSCCKLGPCTYRVRAQINLQINLKVNACQLANQP